MRRDFRRSESVRVTSSLPNVSSSRIEPEVRKMIDDVDRILGDLGISDIRLDLDAEADDAYFIFNIIFTHPVSGIEAEVMINLDYSGEVEGMSGFIDELSWSMDFPRADFTALTSPEVRSALSRVVRKALW